LNFLRFIDSLSYKQIISIAILLAFLFAVPTTVWLVRQQTRLYSSAHKDKLPKSYSYTEEPFGDPSQNPPKILGLKPFLGKVDDVVIISGRDFGQNPEQRAVFFGGVQAAEEDILKWHDDSIEVMVPEGAVSGLVKVVEVDKEDTYSLPFTVYNYETKTRVYWQGNDLMLANGIFVQRAKIVDSSGREMENYLENPQPVMVLFPNLSSKDIINISLYDNRGNLLPFYVNPPEFGF
jgi:hypothetical protein